ncbi:unnamed protein product, partial [Mesocestoides corti]
GDIYFNSETDFEEWKSIGSASFTVVARNYGEFHEANGSTRVTVVNGPPYGFFEVPSDFDLHGRPIPLPLTIEPSGTLRAISGHGTKFTIQLCLPVGNTTNSFLRLQGPFQKGRLLRGSTIHVAGITFAAPSIDLSGGDLTVERKSEVKIRLDSTCAEVRRIETGLPIGQEAMLTGNATSIDQTSTTVSLTFEVGDNVFALVPRSPLQLTSITLAVDVFIPNTPVEYLNYRAGVRNPMTRDSEHLEKRLEIQQMTKSFKMPPVLNVQVEGAAKLPSTELLAARAVGSVQLGGIGTFYITITPFAGTLNNYVLECNAKDVSSNQMLPSRLRFHESAGFNLAYPNVYNNRGECSGNRVNFGKVLSPVPQQSGDLLLAEFVVLAITATNSQGRVTCLLQTSTVSSKSFTALFTPRRTTVLLLPTLLNPSSWTLRVTDVFTRTPLNRPLLPGEVALIEFEFTVPLNTAVNGEPSIEIMSGGDATLDSPHILAVGESVYWGDNYQNCITADATHPSPVSKYTFNMGTLLAKDEDNSKVSSLSHPKSTVIWNTLFTSLESS